MTLRYRLCLAGREPAEVLNGRQRYLLLAELHALGWTDLDIAIHTRWTVYTVARIRDGLGLAANSTALRKSS